ncbi:unnamed protein product, partial [Durusdinium trenchii]
RRQLSMCLTPTPGITRRLYGKSPDPRTATPATRGVTRRLHGKSPDPRTACVRHGEVPAR